MTTDAEVILFETSPYGNVDAIIQHDGRVVFLYLNEHTTDQVSANQSVANPGNRFGTRAVWVRNLVEGPYVLNEDEARSGLPPLMPRTHCVDPKPQPLPAAENLRVVWLEEGNGAALVESDPNTNADQILAVIPPWSGLEGFHGYAAGCAAESPLAWPLPDNPKLQQRLAAADQFWNACQSDNHPFAKLQTEVLNAYRSAFSISQTSSIQNQETYFSIDGGKFPPKGLVQFKIDASGETNQEITKTPSLVIATVGLSLCPQPAVELFTDDPNMYRRIELAIALTDNQASDPALVDGVTRQLSSLAGYPWSHFTWLGPGHTCGLGGAIAGCEIARLVHDRQADTAKPELAPVPMPSFRGDPVNLLWLIPLTTDNQAQLEASQKAIQPDLDQDATSAVDTPRS